MSRGEPLIRQWNLLKALQAHRFGIEAIRYKSARKKRMLGGRWFVSCQAWMFVLGEVAGCGESTLGLSGKKLAQSPTVC